MQDIENGLCSVDLWEYLKRELRYQFFAENIEYIAREKLLALTQTSSIREYVRLFSALMLDIRGMLEKDKIFLFINALQKWAKTKNIREKGSRLSQPKDS